MKGKEYYSLTNAHKTILTWDKRRRSEIWKYCCINNYERNIICNVKLEA